MDYDFFKDLYYYSQLSPQGETTIDDLIWLTRPTVIDPGPIEQVGEPQLLSLKT